MSNLLSQKVKKIPSSEVSADRYQFIKLAEVEPDLGVPDTSNTTPYDANNYVLVSDADGNRLWTNSATFVGFTGSRGYTGSQGDTGFVGSRGELQRWQVINTATTLEDAERYILDSSGGSFDITLPASPTEGDYIQLTDGADLTAYPVTVLANGNTIEGANNDVSLDVGNCSFELIYDGSTWQLTATLGPTGFTGSKGDIGYTGSKGGLQRWSLVTSNTNVDDGDRIILDSSGGSFDITLPATANTGDYIQLTDGGDLTLNTVTVLRNGHTIEDVADDIVLDISDCTFEFIYDGSTWQVTATVGPVGFTGSQGPSTAINATNDTSTSTLYPVMVGTSGSDSTPKVTTSKLYFDASSGTLNVTELNTLSDTRLKENLTPITDPFLTLNNIDGVEFSWKENNKKSFGVSAQQVEKVVPELINNSDYKSVNYSGLIPFLIEAVKDINKKVTKLEKNSSE